MNSTLLSELYYHLRNFETRIYFTEGLEGYSVEKNIIYNKINFTFDPIWCEIEKEDYEDYIWVWIKFVDGRLYCIGSFNLEHEVVSPIKHSTYDSDTKMEEDDTNENITLYETSSEYIDGPNINCFYIYWECANKIVDNFSGITGSSWWHDSPQRYFTNGRLLWLFILKFIRKRYGLNSFFVYNLCLSSQGGRPAPWSYHLKMGMRPFNHIDIQSKLFNSQKNGILNLIHREHGGDNDEIFNPSEQEGGYLFFYYNEHTMRGNPSDYDNCCQNIKYFYSNFKKNDEDDSMEEDSDYDNCYNFYEDYIRLGLGNH